MIRKAKAVWHGIGRDGGGKVSTESRVLAETPYSFRTRFEDEKGCPVSRVLNAAITVDAKLISAQAQAGNRESVQTEPGSS
jgi:hypothetical protein